MSKTVHRERWKADQARRKATALADFPDDAAALAFEADLADQYADACEQLDAARTVVLAASEAGQLEWAKALIDGDKRPLADFLPGPANAAVVALKSASAEVHEMRRYWRKLGEANGFRALGSVRNNVTDPNDDELATWFAERKVG